MKNHTRFNTWLRVHDAQNPGALEARWKAIRAKGNYLDGVKSLVDELEPKFRSQGFQDEPPINVGSAYQWLLARFGKCEPHMPVEEAKQGEMNDAELNSISLGFEQLKVAHAELMTRQRNCELMVAELVEQLGENYDEFKRKSLEKVGIITSTPARKEAA